MSILVLEGPKGPNDCNRCPGPVWLTSYWGERLCQRCCWEAAEEYDREGSWPAEVA